MDESKRAAFTLAEVLITIGVIGVVAAMTLPDLLNRLHNKELHSQFKKVYSELNQIGQLFKADYGLSVTEYAINTSSKVTINLLKNYYNDFNLIDDTTFNTKDDEGNVLYADYDIHALDGTLITMGPCDDLGFWSDGSGKIYTFTGDTIYTGQQGPVVCVDINGRKGPNTYGRDIFIFYFTDESYVYPMGQTYKEYQNDIGSVEDHVSSNFLRTGTKYCQSSSKVEYQASCAYYAAQDISPLDSNKNYWQDFLGCNR